MPIFFLIPVILLIFLTSGGTSFFPGISQKMPPQNLLTQSPCYELEENVKATVDINSLGDEECKTKLDSKTYLRIRQNVKIINGKIAEGKSLSPTCKTSEMVSLREVGKTTDGQRVFWESHNWLKNDMSDFILVFKKQEKGYHYFDVFFEEAKKANIPDFVKNCREISGLVPVLEGPATPTFPPQVISVIPGLAGSEGFSFACCADNYTQYLPVYAKWYAYLAQAPISFPQTKAQKIGEYQKTIGEETRTYEVFFYAGTIWLKDRKDGKVYFYNASENYPSSDIAHNPTLQLSSLKFMTTSEWTWATPECKPALYLYPEQPTQLSVKLSPFGKLTESIPEYGNGWNNLTAYPSGEINYQGKSYPYLYYEAQIEKVKIPQEGFVVAKNDLGGLFAKILPPLGLNPKEAQEFQDFWLANLLANPAPYFFVGILPREEIEQIEPISFSQNPQTFIRLRLYFEPLKGPVPVTEPTLPLSPTRQGFTAVDWGGILHSGSCQNGQIQNQTVR